MKVDKIFIVSAACLIIFSITSCKKDDGFAGNEGQSGRTGSFYSEWLIPVGEVVDGGPGAEGIPSLDNPLYTEPGEAGYLNNNDLVLGFAHNGKAFAYPHKLLDWHEIVNDRIDTINYSVIYCPLTGTGTGWYRKKPEMELSNKLGVSGLLYNSNILPYNRQNGTIWSQMLLKAVAGEEIGQEAETFDMLETSWDTWKKLYPHTLVLSDKTGFDRNYQRYPYDDYKESSYLIFPINNDDTRLDRKERVLGILIDGKAKAYSIEKFGTQISIINDTFNGEDLIIAGSRDKNFITAFISSGPDGTPLEFIPLQHRYPVIMQDNEGTMYDAFGKALAGPGLGNHLSSVTRFMGYWFAWAAFYPDIELY
jgi:hypothetical protein